MAKTDSMTNLLKASGVELSAVKANKILLAVGVLAEKERPSGKDPTKIKKFKVLTEKGLAYGINKENLSNPDETAPNYYVDEFDKLVVLIKEALQ